MTPQAGDSGRVGLHLLHLPVQLDGKPRVRGEQRSNLFAKPGWFSNWGLAIGDLEAGDSGRVELYLPVQLDGKPRVRGERQSNLHDAFGFSEMHYH